MRQCVTWKRIHTVENFGEIQQSSITPHPQTLTRCYFGNLPPISHLSPCLVPPVSVSHLVPPSFVSCLISCLPCLAVPLASCLQVLPAMSCLLPLASPSFLPSPISHLLSLALCFHLLASHLLPPTSRLVPPVPSLSFLASLASCLPSLTSTPLFCASRLSSHPSCLLLPASRLVPPISHLWSRASTLVSCVAPPISRRAVFRLECGERRLNPCGLPLEHPLQAFISERLTTSPSPTLLSGLSLEVQVQPSVEPKPALWSLRTGVQPEYPESCP
jgi:hypothetical protein